MENNENNENNGQMDSEFIKMFGVESQTEVEDIVLENPALFAQKQSEYVKMKQEEAKNSFTDLNAEKQAEFEQKGHKYEDLVNYAKEIGANKVTDRILSMYEKEKAIEKGDSTTADSQKKAGAGAIETGSRTSQQHETTGAKAVRYRNQIR